MAYAKLWVSEDERKKWASSENASKQITESLCSMRVDRRDVDFLSFR